MSAQAESAGQQSRRIFLSYSRSDKQRAAALSTLLTALGHSVFLDHLSLRPGQKWREEIEGNLDGSDMLLVFWTRHSADSAEVRKEYEYFHVKHPNRPIVPLVGDATPLSGILGERQNVDFFPVINELLELSRRMEADGVSKKQIRAAILARLDQAGIQLKRGQRRKFLRLFGIFGIATPVIAVSMLADRIIDSMAHLSLAQAATLGAVAVAGTVTYQFAVQSPSTSVVHLVPVKLGETGSEACYNSNMSCLSLTTMPVRDHNEKFFGFATPSCDSKVIERPSCRDNFATEYAIENVTHTKSPNADEGVQNFSGVLPVCLSSDDGRKGVYRSAYCVKR